MPAMPSMGFTHIDSSFPLDRAGLKRMESMVGMEGWVLASLGN
jgi:hypothetical protein